LEAAIAVGLEHGGWCPRGRRAEDGPIALRYQLTETDSAQYPIRTRLNVVDSAGTLILFRERVCGGTALTHQFARRFGKPCLLVDLDDSPDVRAVRDWIRAHQIDVLNVAGPRESAAPGIARDAQRFLEEVLADSGAAGPGSR